MIRLDPSPTTPAEERAAWEALIAERDAEIAALRERVAAYDSVRDVLVERRDLLRGELCDEEGTRDAELDRLTAALAATEGK